MRLALTTGKGRISPVPDVARQAGLPDFASGRRRGGSAAALPGGDPHSQAAALLALRRTC